MTKDKWKELYMETLAKFCEVGSLTPEGWVKDRKNLFLFIKEVDEATEVYNMENKNGR